ncbi:MAG: hypothetical protein JW982_03495 [Spirochaetes bacterium]|nr:hypothetical protein [Spirochaetota bacterium]
MKKFSVSLTTLKEEFTNTWTLLNDTTLYLQKAGLFNEYEIMLRKWRVLLQKGFKTNSDYGNIKKEIIALRSNLRKEGHDLMIGNMDITVKGFKSDDALKYGFKRAVLYFYQNSILYVTGNANHRDLMREFENRISGGKSFNYRYVHSIWFRWNRNTLEIAGADSEAAEDYEILKDFIEKNRMYTLKRLKNMR